jgi:uncharacterized protein YceH (UPF0502 family)
MDLTELTPMQVRVLGALMEKKETTPDQYPLTLNALRNACNQKSARNPVVAFTEGQVGHTVRELEGLGLVREAWGARAAKYEHLAGKALGLPSKGLALMCVLMLRGPQTPGELRTNTQRLWEFGDLDDVHYALQRLQEHDPPFVTCLPRVPGQKEARYAHLLSGEPDPEDYPKDAPTAHPTVDEGLEARVATLETEVAELRRELSALLSR